MFRSLIYFELIFIYVLRVLLHSFACDYLTVPAPSGEKLSSLILSVLSLLNHDSNKNNQICEVLHNIIIPKLFPPSPLAPIHMHTWVFYSCNSKTKITYNQTCHFTEHIRNSSERSTLLTAPPTILGCYGKNPLKELLSYFFTGEEGR